MVLCMSELKINRSEGISDHAKQFEVDKLQKSITSLEHNISDINSKFEKEMEELAEEKNYDIYFKIGIPFGAIWFVYKVFTDSWVVSSFSFIFFAIICGLFFAYKKFLNKEARVKDFKEKHQQKLQEQEELLAKRREELSKFEK